MDATVGCATAKVHQEEMTPVLVWEAGPGIEAQPRRTVGDIRDRGNDVGGLPFERWIPESLGAPWTARIGAFEKLVADAPAAVAAFDQVDPARLVAAVGIVVAGEQISILIERQGLRIAQAEGEHLQLRPVRIAAKNAAAVRIGDDATFGLYRRGAITDAEVEFAVGAEPQSMQVVSDEADAHTEPVVDRFSKVGNAVTVG